MSYSFDKERNKFVVRATVEGKRLYIGRFDTTPEAVKAEEKYLRALKNLNKQTINNQPLKYEVVDTSFDWVGKFRKWRADLKKKREAAKIAR